MFPKHHGLAYACVVCVVVCVVVSVAIGGHKVVREDRSSSFVFDLFNKNCDTPLYTLAHAPMSCDANFVLNFRILDCTYMCHQHAVFDLFIENGYYVNVL